MSSIPKSSRELRTFGLAFGAGLSLLGSLLLWRQKPPAPFVLGGAALILALALLMPRALRPLEWLLAKTVRGVTTVMTYVILTLVFVLVLTPLGLLRRLLGKDGLGRRPDPARPSYWLDVPPDGPSSRPEKPY